MSALAPTVRKDSAQSSKEGVCKAIAQAGGHAEPQHGNTDATVRTQSKLTQSHIPTRSNSSNNTVTGPAPSSTRKTAHQQNHANDESSCAGAVSPDIVTNKERTKPSTITRVLSPMRPRRTPVLVNAPDVRWRLDPRLRHMPSLDSVLTSSTTSGSEASTVRLFPVPPHNIALPSSVASSLLTVMPEETNPLDIPLPPSPPPTVSHIATRYNETIERPRPVHGHYLRQTHHLSPVTEASSGFSLRSLGSSIVDLEIQDVATAERHGLNEITKQNIHVLSAHRSQVSLNSQHSRQSRFRERFSLDGREYYADSLRSGDVSGTPVMGLASENAERDVTDADEGYVQQERKIHKKKKARTICGRIRKLKTKVSRFGGKVGQNVARKLGLWVGLEWV